MAVEIEIPGIIPVVKHRNQPTICIKISIFGTKV